MTVTMQMEEEVKCFKDVTKVETFCAFDMFENKIVIHQGKKKTTFKQYEVIGYEVKE